MVCFKKISKKVLVLFFSLLMVYMLFQIDNDINVAKAEKLYQNISASKDKFIDDTGVYDQWENNLYVGQFIMPALGIAQSYIGFPIDSLPDNIESIKLYIYVGPFPSCNVTVHGSLDDVWSETDDTAPNKVVEIVENKSLNTGWQSIDVTQFILDQYASDKYATLVISPTDTVNQNSISFGSSESGNSPYLKITSTNPSFTAQPIASITEDNIDGIDINIAIADDSFISSSLNKDMFTLQGDATANGVFVDSVVFVDSTHATLKLAHDGRDFDERLSFQISIDKSQLTAGNTLLQNGYIYARATYEITSGGTYYLEDLGIDAYIIISTSESVKLTQRTSTIFNNTTIAYSVSGADLKLDSVYIDNRNFSSSYTIDFMGASNALVISGQSDIKSYSRSPAISVDGSTELSISGTGSLSVTGGESCPAIGSRYSLSSGTINISSGTISAYGGKEAAAIGSGNGSTGTINISGGTIYARGGDFGAGIGGGEGATVGTINISGGTITAVGGWISSGIGGGLQSVGGVINISGGIIYAEHTNIDAEDIGNGRYGTGCQVSITGKSIVFLYVGTLASHPNNLITIPYYDTGQIASNMAYGYSVPTNWANGSLAYAYITEHIFATGVVVSTSTNTLVLGDGITSNNSVSLTATVSPSNADDKSVTWTSSNTSVATVDVDGIVTAQSAGTATITVTADDTINGTLTDSCIVTVEQAVTTVTISSHSEKLILDDNTTINDIVDLDVIVLPIDATYKTVSYISSDPSVATVNSVGVVTAQSVGTATITVTADGDTNGTISDTCTITVEQGVTNVTLSSNAETLNPNQSVQLTETVLPNDATYPTVTWTSDNINIATVDTTGKVTAIANGTVVIEATADIMTTSNRESDQCTITVETLVSGIALNTVNQTIEKGETYKLEATVNPQEASHPSVTWASSDESIATVGQDGLVTAVSDGSATIIASAEGKSATCDAIVKTSVQSITLSKNSLSIDIGDKHTLAASVNPSDATYPTVAWTSSDTAIATVNQTGEVAAVGYGSAIITAQADGVSAQCAISVKLSVTGVVLSSSYETVSKGRSFILTATVSPSNATNKNISWQSSDSSVATVDQNGKVIAEGQGTASITAIADGKKSSCTVKVVIYVKSVNISNASIKMNKGDTYTLSAEVSPNDASDKSITWKSSNTAVASVSQNGVVTANDKGTTVITATAGGKSNTCDITVEVPAIGVTLSNTTLSMDAGDSVQLSTAINPGDATNQSISWQSSDVNVVTVNSSGLVNAIGGGNATVSASIDGKTATCTVIVSDTTQEDRASEVSSSPSQEVTPTLQPTLEKIIISTTSANVDDETGIITLEIDISNFPNNTVSIMLPDGRIISMNEAVNGMLSISIGVDELNSDGELELVIIDDSEVAFGAVSIQITLDDEKTVWPLILAGFLGLILVAGGLLIRIRQTSLSRQRAKRQR